MARRVVEELVDDIDGSEASETLQFALDGVTYELDLNEANAAELREALDPYIAVARHIGGRPRRGRKPRAESNGHDNTAVRAWAEANGYKVSKRGRISREIIDAFVAVGN